MAFIISPYTGKEEVRFAKIGQTISAFISGYLLSKIDKPITAYIEYFTGEIGKGEIILVLDDLNKVRIIGFMISFILTTVVVYVFRAAEYDKKQAEIEENAKKQVEIEENAKN